MKKAGNQIVVIGGSIETRATIAQRTIAEAGKITPSGTLKAFTGF